MTNVFLHSLKKIYIFLYYYFFFEITIKMSTFLNLQKHAKTLKDKQNQNTRLLVSQKENTHGNVSFT